MYADVVVLTYQAPDIGYFTYKVPEILQSRIKQGQIVEVPFGKRNPLGVVISTRSDLALRQAQGRTRESAGSDLDPNKIKTISAIVTESPILLPYQIKLLDWMANYYIAPAVNCLEAILPFNEVRLREFISQEIHPRGVFGSASRHHPGGDKLPAQTLILVPSINKIPETLAKHKSKEYLIFHNQLKVKEKFDVWTSLLSKEVETVFGLRSAIFLPFQNLARIIIYDEHENAYKDERSPYYDSLTVLDKICQFTGANLEIIDDAPKVTTYFEKKNSVRFSPKKTLLKIRIVSLKDEKRSGNKSPISELLQKLIIQNYKLKGATFLFLNKKKESGSFYCRACQTHLFLEKAPKQCPQCKSFDFFFHSLNIQNLKKEVEKLIPNSEINLLTEKSSLLQTTHYKLPTIDIATSAIFYSQNLIKYDLVAHFSIDHLLNLPEYSSAEKTYQQITGLKKLANDKGIIILQSYDPENLVIQAAANDNYQTFFENEIEERKMLLYPPSALLVKLTIKGKSEEKIMKKALDLNEKLNASNIPNLKITGPFVSVFRKKTPSYNIILKMPTLSYSLIERENAVKKLHIVLKNLSKEWQIIVEAESIN